MEFLKYPRTQHIEGSKIQKGDEDLKQVSFDFVKGNYCILEEKVDGANTGISFDGNGKLYLQSRGHVLNGGYGEKQFTLFKKWANCYQYDLYQILKDRYIMYGEWLYAKHTVFYDALTHYFMEFDIYDKKEKIFLSTKRRQELLKNCPYIVSVLVVYEGSLNSLEQLKSFLENSHFKSESWKENLETVCKKLNMNEDVVKKQTDNSDFMEGIYIKIEDEQKVVERLKYVRSSFLNTILNSETHWKDRPIVPNQLKQGISIFP